MENIKNLKVNKEKVTNFFKKGALFVLIGGLLFLLAGCQEDRLLATNSEAVYDVIDTTDETLLNEGIEQILDVPNEEFKLKVNYKCVLAKNAKWTITGDKQIFSEISTVGLPEGYKVYVDNVHTDTTIRSIYPTVDGITQDTMDDRLHAGQLLGFPISDTNVYGNINSIEGQNDNFISATCSGFVGASAYIDNHTTSSSSTSMTYVHLDERRRTESEYLLCGVYANKIDSVIDLIIEKPDGTKTCTSVNSVVEVSVWPYVTYKDGMNRTCHIYYFIDKNTGKVAHQELNNEEYQQHVKSMTSK